MAKKIVIPTEDFKMIVDFIYTITIPFSQCEKAAEIMKAIGNAKEYNIQEDNNGSKQDNSL